MEWVKELLTFISSEWEIILENRILFLTYGTLCIGIGLVISQSGNSYLTTKYEKLCDQMAELQEENSTLKSENEELKNKYKKFNEKTRLMMGTEKDTMSLSADLISKKFNKSNDTN